MRAVDVRAVTDVVASGVESVVELTRDVHRAVATGALDATEIGVGSAVTPVRTVHDAISASVYEGVRVALPRIVRGAGRVVAAGMPTHGAALADLPTGAPAVATLNGLWGDRLTAATASLDLGVRLRHDGVDLPVTRASLARAHPDATGRVAVFVHGLLETEASWWRAPPVATPDGMPTHGHRLRRDLGFTPVWVRYNTGRRVSHNGADLDALVEALHERWPVPVTEIALVGHSMGGLVARSAVAAGAARRTRWVASTKHVVCLGSPHHGAPLERLANVTAWVLRAVAVARPFAGLLDSRSGGIKDLRYGNVSDEDWTGTDPDALLTDTRTDATFVDGVAYHAIGVRIRPGPVGHAVGDGLVRMASATGQHRRGHLPFDRAVEIEVPMHHLALLNHPVVHEHVRAALVAPTGASVRPPV